MSVISVLHEWGIKLAMDNPQFIAGNDELQETMNQIAINEDISFLDKFKRQICLRE